jgi:hypothetical protein
MKTMFSGLILIHGLIHLLGFVKAFKLAPVSRLTQPVTKSAGVLWLASALLFVVALCLLAFDVRFWWGVAAAAVVMSQIVIFRSWADAKFGSMVNVLILIPIVVAFAGVLPSSYPNRFRTESEQRLLRKPSVSLLGEEDIRRLPPPVQKYLRYVGAVGKPRVYNVRVVSRGSMKREKDGNWMDIVARQYDFFDDVARLFYIESSVFGIPFDGLHMYVGSNATMEIHVASMFPVADAKGEKMTHGETVTLFNDMCVLAPAALIDTSIEWKPIDSLNIEGKFTNRGNTITARLTFNEEGAMTDFTSNDRYLSADGKTYESYPWSTPVSDYREYDGRKVARYGEAIWHMPGGKFTYAKFTIDQIEYNCTEFR